MQLASLQAERVVREHVDSRTALERISCWQCSAFPESMFCRTVLNRRVGRFRSSFHRSTSRTEGKGLKAVLPQEKVGGIEGVFPGGRGTLNRYPQSRTCLGKIGVSLKLGWPPCVGHLFRTPNEGSLFSEPGEGVGDISESAGVCVCKNVLWSREEP